MASQGELTVERVTTLQQQAGWGAEVLPRAATPFPVRRHCHREVLGGPITDLKLASRLTVKLIEGGITDTGRLRILTPANLMHGFAISSKVLAQINEALLRAGEPALD
jgi:hypothetical protein